MRLDAEFLNEGVHVDANPKVEVDIEEQGISTAGSKRSNSAIPNERLSP